MPEDIVEHRFTYIQIEPAHTYDDNFPPLEIEKRDSKIVRWLKQIFCKHSWMYFSGEDCRATKVCRFCYKLVEAK